MIVSIVLRNTSRLVGRRNCSKPLSAAMARICCFIHPQRISRAVGGRFFSVALTSPRFLPHPQWLRTARKSTVRLTVAANQERALHSRPSRRRSRLRPSKHFHEKAARRSSASVPTLISHPNSSADALFGRGMRATSLTFNAYPYIATLTLRVNVVAAHAVRANQPNAACGKIPNQKPETPLGRSTLARQFTRVLTSCLASWPA